MEKSYSDAFKNDNKPIINEKYKPVLEEIDKTIEFLQAIRYTLKNLGQNLPELNATAKNVASNLGIDVLFNEKSK